MYALPGRDVSTLDMPCRKSVPTMKDRANNARNPIAALTAMSHATSRMAARRDWVRCSRAMIMRPFTTER